MVACDSFEQQIRSGVRWIRGQLAEHPGPFALVVPDLGAECVQGHRAAVVDRPVEQMRRFGIANRQFPERIVGLGGTLVIDSTTTGVTLSIKVPLASADAPDDDSADRR